MKRWTYALMVAGLLAVSCGDDDPRPAPRDAGSTLPDKTAGNACTRDEDCSPGHCARRLRIQTATGVSRAPGGYCTLDCVTDSDCGAGGECTVPAGADSGECLGHCGQNEDCRAGYSCVGASSVRGGRLSGTCQPKVSTEPIDDGVVGRGCGSDNDCGGGQCQSTDVLGTPLPGNYCSASCYEDSECGVEGGCLLLTGGGDVGRCFRRCAADADCARDGYRCRPIGPGLDACYPAPEPLPDRTAGKPCDGDADCGGSEGSCASELPFGSFQANEIVPAPGGYCTQPCSLDVDCGERAQCVSRGFKGGLCLGRCVEPSDCRTGYMCMMHGRDESKDERVCVPLLTGAEDAGVR